MAVTRTRRTLATLMALALVVALLPMLPSAAWADDADTIETEATLSTSSGGQATAASNHGACPSGIVPDAGFTDVGGAVGGAANCLAWYGITQGRTATTYDALSGVRRDQLASFLVNTMRQSPDFTLPERRFGAFPDVGVSVHTPNIETLAGFNPPIVQGYADGRYGPLDTVTRAQAASFLFRSYNALRAQFPAQLPALPSGNRAAFPDVASSNVHAQAIASLNAAGIIQGFADGTFGPNRTLNRGQMALLLTRMLERLVAAGVVERPDGGPTDPVPTVGTLTGTVLDDDDDSAISGASVSVTGAASRSTTTAANGSFTLADLPVGSYTVTADADDFDATTANVTIAAGQTATVTLRLAPTEPLPPTAGTITGTVVDAGTEAAIGGAAVTLSDGATELSATTTAGDGTFTFAEVAAGSYTLAAVADGYDLATAEVTVTAGETTTATLALSAETDPTEPGDPVGNPGPLTVTVTEGSLSVGSGEDALAFDFPECVDGVPSEGDSCVTFSGEVDEDGNLTVPADGVSFPALQEELEALPGVMLGLNITITAPEGATGSIDPATGALTWDTVLDISVTDEDGLLPATCGLSGIALSMTVGDSGALSGVAYDQEDGTATVVDNQFTVPSASGCGSLLGMNIDEVVNDSLGLPTEAGEASVRLVQQFDPILVAGEATDPTDPTEPELGAVDVMAAATTTVHSLGADLDSSDGEGTLDLDVVLRDQNGAVYTVPEGETVEVDWEATAGAADVALTDLVASATAVLDAEATATGTLVFEAGTSTYELSADAVAPTTLEIAFSAEGAEGDGVTLTWNAPPPGALEGTVTDGTSEDLLEGVEVTLTDADDGTVTATTDETGTYGFADLTRGTYTATFSLDGYGTATETVEVEAGTTTTLDVALLELGEITGTVTDGGTFLPVAGATVVVAAGETVVAETTTEQDGTFAVTVPAGSYLVTASSQDLTGASETVEVAPGQSVDVDFTLVELATISGQLLDEESGDPVEGATVTVLTANPGQFVASTTTDADGRYTLRVPPGSYQLVFDREAYDRTTRNITVGSGDQATVNAPITPRTGIGGQVTDSERGLPVEGARIDFISPVPVVGPITIDVNSADLSLPGGAFGGTRSLSNVTQLEATIDEAGQLSIPSGQRIGSWVMNFAHASTPAPTDYDVRMDLNLTGNGTGQIDAETGAVNVNGTFEVRATQITENFGGTAGGRGSWPLNVGRTAAGAPENCRVPNINIGTTTGVSGPLTGSPIDPFTGEATLVGAQFTVPGFQGCPSFSSPTLNVNTYANGLLGLASNTLGNNRLVLDVDIPVNATTVVTDAEGRYTVNLPTGPIFTFIERDGFASLRDEDTIEDGQLREFYARDFVLTATRSALTGSVSDAYTGADLEGAVVTATQDDIGLVETTTTDATGAYNFPSLPRGPVDITVEQPGYEVFEETTLLRAAQQELLEVALTPILSTLDGAILDDIDGQPVGDAEVTLTELREVEGEVTEIEFGTTTSAADGSYAFEGIPQGTYQVTAGAFEYVTTTVDGLVFTPGAELVQDVRLPQVGIFTGTVTDDATGAPISGAEVTVTETGESVFTDGDGVYRITVVGGSYRLEFEAAGYAPAFREVTVANGQTLTVNVELDEYTTAGGGTIRDGLTGNRLAGATVRVLDAGGTEVESLTTDGDGRFTLPALDGGSYALEVSADGFLTRTYPITVVPGQPLTANLALDPVATVAGVVTATETGDPVEDATVSITSGGTTVATATTDADGSYAVELAGGSYAVSITAEDRNTVTENVTLVRGGSVTVDAALTLLPATLTVTTTDAQTEAGVEGATVTVRQGGSTVVAEDTDAAGTATFELAPGTYEVIATADNYGGATSDVTLAPAEEASLALTLDPDAASAAVTVTDAFTDAPVPGATIDIVDADEEVLATATTDAEGQATLTDLPQGDHLVVVAADGYETDELAITLAPGEAAQLEFALAPLPSTVSGLVTDSVSDDGVDGATVTLSTEDGEVATVTTDTDGAYEVSGLDQGTYEVTVTADDYEDGAGTASVGPGGSDTVDVALVPFAEILGEVVDATTGEPIANLGVRILDGGVPVEGVTVDQATATFGASVPAGSYTIEILSAGLSITTRNVTVAPAQQLLETFVVQLGQVTGVVTDDETGEAIEDALVTFTRTLGGQTGTVTTDSDGAYRIDVQPGGYAITVSATGYDTANVPAQSFGTDGGVVDVALTALPGSVTGTVVNDVTGTPVVGASVSLLDGEDEPVATTTSGSDGSFTLSDVERGTYTIVIDAGEGYDLLTQGDVVVTQGQSLALGEIPVTSLPGDLSGTVTSGGDPVEGASVDLLDGEGAVVESATTDEDGEYEIPGVTTGDYTARISASGFVTVTEAVSFGPGESVTLDVSLTPVGTVEVTVVDQDEQPISASVALTSNGDVVASFDGASGTLEAAVGTYTVTAEREGYDGDSTEVTLEAGANEPLELRITAQPTTIQGAVTDGVSGDALEGVTVTLTDGDEVELTTTTGEAGSYAFEDVDAGTYTVAADLDGYGPVSAEVTTEPGQTVTQNLAFDWTVRVTVRDADGSLYAGQGVSISDGETTVVATTDSAGQTRLTLAPGTYTLSAQIEGRAPISRQITVNEGVTQSVTLTAQLPSSIAGTVASSFEDTLLEDAEVVLLQGGQVLATDVTDEDGSYGFGDLAAGVYQLQASAMQHESNTFSVTVPAATEVTRDLVLEATPVTVSGTVTDVDGGAPVAGASLTFVRQSTGEALAGEVLTDEDGTYSRPLPVDTYTVIADADGYDAAEGEVVSSFDVESEQTLDLVLALETGIFGVVTNNVDGAPLDEVSVHVLDEDGEVVRQTVTAADGSYRIVGFPEETVLRFSRIGFITSTQVVETEPRTENRFDLVLAAGISAGPVELTGLGGLLGLGEDSDPFEFPAGVRMVGELAEDGTLTVPRNRISFPEISEPVDAGGITVTATLSVLALSDAVGFVDVETGEVTLDLDIGIRVRGTAPLVGGFGGPNCGTGWGDQRGPAIQLRGTTGESGTFTGEPVDLVTRTFTLVDNQLTVSAVTGCGSLVGNDVNALLNDLLGIEPGGETEPGAVFIELDFRLD